MNADIENEISSKNHFQSRVKKIKMMETIRIIRKREKSKRTGFRE